MACPEPRRIRTGELECPACGRGWDVWDPKPDCGGDPRDRTRIIADRELAKIRRLLNAEPGIPAPVESTMG